MAWLDLLATGLAFVGVVYAKASNAGCSEPLVELLIIVGIVAVLHATHFFLMSLVSLASDTEWRKNLIRIFIFTLMQLGALIWGSLLVLLNNPIQGAWDDSLKMFIRSKGQCTKLGQPVCTLDVVCFNAAPSLYYMSCAVMVLLTLNALYAVHVTLMQLLPSMRVQLREVRNVK